MLQIRKFRDGNKEVREYSIVSYGAARSKGQELRRKGWAVNATHLGDPNAGYWFLRAERLVQRRA